MTPGKAPSGESGLIKSLKDMRGNVRACVYTEPLWGIPYNLFIPFATVYMYALGVRDVQIGLLLSIGMAFQVLFSVLGGIVTDKLGRRMATVIFDLTSWVIPCLIWAFAQNYWWFLAAIIFNASWQIPQISWNCLLVEDCHESQLINVYNWVHILNRAAVLFAPVSYFLVERFTLVPTVRALYLFSAILMTIKFIILFRYSTETEMGRQRKAETASLSPLRMLSGYGKIIRSILQTPQTLFLIGFLVMFGVGTMVTSNFFGLYVTKNLMIPERYLALFPMVRAFFVLAFMFLLQDRINKLPLKQVMALGLILFAAANLSLILVPTESLGILMIYVVGEALAYTLVNPRKDFLFVRFVDKEQRARVSGVIYVFIIGLNIPFGWFIGLLSSWNRIYPFILNILLYLVCFVMIARSRELEKDDRSQRPQPAS